MGAACRPVAPHQYARINNVFEVVRGTLRAAVTAYSDKETCAYTLYQGPSGRGVTDLYDPEARIPPIIPCMIIACAHGMDGTFIRW